MADVSVRRLIFVNHKLEDPVEVALPPWDQIPREVQKGFSGLDKDHDASLVIDTGAQSSRGYIYRYLRSGETTPDYKVEVGNLDGSQETFLRYFWAFRGDNPNNHAQKDVSTRLSREAAAQAVEDAIVAGYIPKILSDPRNPLQWEEVWSTLMTFADARHLYQYATEDLYPLWKRTGDRRFLDLAHRFLMEAKRFAAGTHEGRSGWLGKIMPDAEKFGAELDRLEQKDFQQAKQGPYLLNNRGAPMTFEEGQGRTIVLRVSVPKSYSSGDLTGFFRKNPVSLVPSRFKGTVSVQDPIPLIPSGKVEDQDLENRAYYDHEQTTTVTFQEEGRKDFWMAFTLPEGVRVGDLREGLTARSYDLLQTGAGGQVLRNIPGAVVFQSTQNKSVRLAFASDLHIAERDYTNLKLFFEEVRKELADYKDQKVSHRPLFDPKNHYHQRIERYYASINESVEAMVAIWNERYRTGRLDKVILTGDLVDFINIAAHMKRMGFRGTNVHRLEHILDKLEVPLYMIWGNHDPHIVPYALSFRKEYFSDDRDIYKDGITLLDRAYLGTENPVSLAGLSVKALLSSYCSDGESALDCFLEAGRRLMQANVFGIEKEGMQPHFQNFQSSAAFVTSVHRQRYFVMMDTGIEDFALKKYMKEGVPAPVITNAFNGAHAYLGDMAASGLGPSPAAAGFIVRQIKGVMSKKGRATLVGHYPVFNGGIGPGGAPSTVDTLQAPVAWFFRLLPYYYVYRQEDHGQEGPVVDSFLAGHLHRTGVFTYHLDFESPEQEEAFRRELGVVYEHAAQGSPEIYREMEQLAHKYGLDSKIEIPGGKNPKEIDDPVKAVARLHQINKDSRNYTKEHGAVFLNLPAAGPPTSDASPGFIEMTIEPDGRMEFHPYFVRLEPDGRVLAGSRVDVIQKEHDRMVSAWKASIGIKVPLRGSRDFEAMQKANPIHGDPLEVRLPGYEKPDGVPEKEPSVDAPLFTNKIGWYSLQAGYQGGVNVLDGGWRNIYEVAQLSIPISDIYKPIGPNAFLLGVLYGHDRWMPEVGLDLGLLQFQFASDILNVYGASASVQWPIPAVFLPALWYSYDRQRDEHMGLLGLKFELTPLSWKFD